MKTLIKAGEAPLNVAIPGDVSMNVKLLREIQDGVRLYPNQVGMEFWFFDAENLAKENQDLVEENNNTCEEILNNCGTTACIAGWALYLRRVPLERFELKEDDDEGDVDFEQTGRRVLGLTQAQADRLFFLKNWPSKFIARYKDGAESLRGEAVADRIEHFIRTYGAE